MTECRKYCETKAGSDESKQSGGKTKTNRLRRSLKLPQETPSLIDSPKTCQDFKTPTRVTRSRYNNVFNRGESPMNESDLQQDIIWDATTPSPLRTGSKRGKKYSANVGIVDISEIVNRIAPKHGRPVVPESSLLQWIGDSAIPCTPEMHQPRTKKKSPRPNGVDDLLKLAKQFDFNMFQQDEERVNDMHEQSLELLSDSEDILDLDGNEKQPPPLLSNVTPESTQSALKPNSRRNSKDQIPPDREMEDDLDFLFDGPTQDVSGNLSQNSLPQSLEVKTALTVSSKVIPGKYPDSKHGHTLTVSPSHPVKRSSANNFDDDWENDDLLDDLLVFEMTQNPDLFAVPNHCSTQKGSNEREHENNNPSAVSKNVLQGSRDIKPAVSKGQNETVKNRKTFTLEANPNVQAKSILSEALPKAGHVSDTVKPAPHRNVQKNKPSLFPINKALSMKSSYQRSQQTQHQSNGIKTWPQVPLFQSTSISTSSSTSTSTNSYSTWPLQAENSSYHMSTENNNMKGTGIVKAPASHSVVPEDDLDSLFASDSIWDDRDDDLLYQACDNLESQVQSMEDPVITRSQSLPSNKTESQKFVPVSAPLNSSRCNVNQTAETTQSKYPNISVYSQSASGNSSTFTHSLHNNKVPVTVVSGSNRPSYNASAGNSTANSTYRPQNPAAGDGPYKNTCVAGSTANQQGTGSGARPSSFPSPVNVTETPTQFTFKRPSGCASNPVIPVTNKAFASTQAAGKCSVVEIELKKQWAMERRRQLMQTAHNLRAPT